MAWEARRNGKLYYYRSRRLGRRVVKDYFGCGPAAEEAARQDEARRVAQAARRQEQQEQRKADTALSREVLELTAESTALLEAALLGAGFHRPRRKPWRKRRPRRDDHGDKEG